MPLDLTDLEETCSLLVPAYGITGRTHAARHDCDPEKLVGPAKDESETYGLLHRDDWYVLPRGTTNFLFGASALFNDAIGPVGERRIIRLREAADPMPEDRVNTCLMVQGMRTCMRRRHDRSDFIRGYAAWVGPPDAHRWIGQIGHSQPGTERFLSKSVLFGRMGRCALYAPSSDDLARILLLDFHLADREPASPDLLLVWASCSEVRNGSMPYLDPKGSRLGDDWRALVTEAIEGYRSEHGP